MGKACTLFGHSDCPSSIKPKLHEVLVDLIENHAVDTFYVGRQGSYDALVRSVLKELVSQYSHITYAVVLERMPKNQTYDDPDEYADTLLPDGIESVHPRYAITWRNRWMIKQSDYVVTYITHSWGGAAQFAELAERKGKTVINISKANNADQL